MAEKIQKDQITKEEYQKLSIEEKVIFWVQKFQRISHREGSGLEDIKVGNFFEDKTKLN